jgi:hypothetical protein
MKKAVFAFLAVAILAASTALPLLAEPAPAAAPAQLPAWLAGLTPAADTGLRFLPQPIQVTACSFPDQQACNQSCHQACRAMHCFGGLGTCTLEEGCTCGECTCP